MANPDGVDLVNGAAGPEVFGKALDIAAAFPSIPFTQGWKANTNGTDPNLNYPAEWEKAREIKFGQGYTKPAPRDYVGEAPLSAPESRALYEFTLKHNFALTVSYHTQGEEIYWKFSGIEPEGAREIAENMAAVSGYSIADVPYESGFAGYKDWFIQETKKPGFTIEAGRGVNPLPLSQYDRIRQDNFPLMAAAMEAAMQK
jgi:g-D-glutamyl-meso-diaminopimelate peptidase